jgi:hypothetical protein
MRRRALSVLAAVVFCVSGVFAAFTVTGASAHQNGCHSAHSCPSDHHTYIWYDANGQGWDCAEPGAPEYNPAVDTTTIVYAGLPYYCHAAGSTNTAPATTTAPTTTGATTTTGTAGTTTAATTTTVVPVPTGPGSTVSSGSTGSTGGAGKAVRLRARTKTSGCRLGPLPDRRCSPGAYYSGLTKVVLCSSSFHTSSVRTVPESEKHAVEVEYRLAAKSYGRTLEIDHIVSLELGGSNDISNLFPERAPGYHGKDKLENKLHALVCSGAMTLHTAQAGIAANWEALYTRVFGTAPNL